MGSTRAVHRLSDTICIENGYSIVEAPKRRGQSYNKWLGDAAKPSHKEQLRQAIDRALAQKPASLEELLRLLEQDGYTLDDLLAVLSGQKEHTPRKQPAPQAAPSKVNLLVDIQAKLQAGKGAGYVRWAKVFNLKQMTHTLNYLSEHGLLDYADLEAKTAEATAAIMRCPTRSGCREAHGRDRRATHPHRQLRQDPQHLCGLPQGRVFKEIQAGA